MEKNRWSLIFIGLCLALAFSVSSVEAEDLPEICEQMKFCDRDTDGFFKDHKRCTVCGGLIDCNDTDFEINPGEGEVCGDLIDNNCNGAVDEAVCDGGTPPPFAGPRIADVRNSAGIGIGSAALYITEKVLHGTYTPVKIKDFNNWDAQTLRNKVDVVHVVYSSSPSIDASWAKLRDFMNAQDEACGDGDGCPGGSIFWEDPSNNIFDIEGLHPDLVQEHVPGDDPAIVWFEAGPSTGSMYDEPEEILSAFTAIGHENGGYFLPGITLAMPPAIPVDVDHCAGFDPTFTTNALGFGCLVNNHITFEPDPGLGLLPFIRLLVNNTPADPIVAVYGIGHEHPDAPLWRDGLWCCRRYSAPNGREFSSRSSSTSPRWGRC